MNSRIIIDFNLGDSFCARSENRNKKTMLSRFEGCVLDMFSVKGFDPVVVSCFETKKCAKKKIINCGIDEFQSTVIFSFANNNVESLV